MKHTMILSAVAVLSCLVSVGVAAPTGRQSYSGWNYNATKGYHYREYSYKVKPADKVYKHQYVIYYKNDVKKKNWVYYYNPESKKVWCRYPTVNHPTYGNQVKKGKELWSVLPKEKRHADVYKIDDKAYGKPGDVCPTIPEATDKQNMQLPPNDLP